MSVVCTLGVPRKAEYSAHGLRTVPGMSARCGVTVAYR